MQDNTSSEERKPLKHEGRNQMGRARKRSGSVVAGLVLLVIGSILLFKEFGVAFPAWLFSWPMILIAIGLFAGAANSFRDPGWAVISGVGFVFLLGKIWPDIPIYHFIWPVLIIALGLIIIMAPRRNRMWWQGKNPDWNYYNVEESVTTDEPETTPVAEKEKAWGENWLDIVSIFSNIKKTVYTKNFKGGDIVSIFAGAEVNLTRAEFNGNVVIEIVQIFGGTKLIVPPHWQIRSAGMVAVFGGIEDKRAPQTNYDTDKVIILNGTTIFGGIEIKSY
jgi:predicted membrane protein